MTKYYETVYASNLDMSLIFLYTIYGDDFTYDQDAPAPTIVDYYYGTPDDEYTKYYLAQKLGVKSKDLTLVEHPYDHGALLHKSIKLK